MSPKPPRIKITNRKEFPTCVRKFDVLKGICVGSCVDDADQIENNLLGHGHLLYDNYEGWICVSDKLLLRNRNFMLHEMAHLFMTYGDGHGQKWKKKLIEIGGNLGPYKIGNYEFDYRKKLRKKLKIKFLPKE